MVRDCQSKILKQYLSDQYWRLNNLYRIINEQSERVLFKMRMPQEKFYREMWYWNELLKSRQHGFCLSPATKILTSGLEWLKLADIQIGQQIVSVDENTLGGRGAARRMRVGVVEAVRAVERPSYKITFDDGRAVICTGEHKWLTAPRKNGPLDWRAIENSTKKKLRVGGYVRWIAKPWGCSGYEDGWFGGIMDGEGSFKGKSGQLAISQRSGDVWDRIIEYLTHNEYHHSKFTDDRKRMGSGGFSNRPVERAEIYRGDEIFRLIGQTRPSRFLANPWWNGKELPGKRSGIGWAKVVSIETVGMQKMIDLQTSEKTFIAEGFVSHNSTLIDLIGLDLCLFNDNIEAGIVAHTLKDVQHIFETKIKYPYNNLPEWIKDRIPALKCDANEIKLANNSWLRVATSMRSSTLRFLHVSERGKICAKYPQKAVELKTGTLPTLHEGSYFFDESTAEGGAGDFYDACTQAQADTAREKQGIPLNKMQCRFHFFAWHDDPKNATEPKGIVVSDELRRYFKELADNHDITLTDRQKAWYALKRDGAQGLGRLMKREHPSFPAEAFEQAVEGAVFGVELEKARTEGRVRFVPYEENEPVYTFWDLGIGHPTAVIFTQFIAGAVHVIDYHEESNRGIVYHCKVIKDKPYIYEHHYVPHDARKRSMETATPLMDTMRELLGSTNVTVVPRCQDKGDSIESARRIFPHVFFDAKKTTRLVKCLAFYRYEWDEEANRFRDKPEDDWSADGADAFQGMGMVWITTSIGGKRLGRTEPIRGNIPPPANKYGNSVLTRGLARTA